MAVKTIRIEGLEGVLKTLKQLPRELVSKRGGPVRSALRKASKILADEMKANIEKIIDEPNISGNNYNTGLLLKNIVITRSSKMREKGERFIVRVRRKPYPKVSDDAKTVTTSRVASLLESGTERRRPMPWARPAFDAKKHQVIPLFVSELNRHLTRIVNKLAKQNGVA